MPRTQDEILAEIQKARGQITQTETEISQIRVVGGNFGPMDETPWTAPGQRIAYLKEKIEDLTKELGGVVVRERLG